MIRGRRNRWELEKLAVGRRSLENAFAEGDGKRGNKPPSENDKF